MSIAERADIDDCGYGTEFGCGRMVHVGQDCLIVLNGRPNSWTTRHVIFHKSCAPPGLVPAFWKNFLKEKNATPQS